MKSTKSRSIPNPKHEASNGEIAYLGDIGSSGVKDVDDLKQIEERSIRDQDGAFSTENRRKGDGRNWWTNELLPGEEAIGHKLSGPDGDSLRIRHFLLLLSTASGDGVEEGEAAEPYETLHRISVCCLYRRAAWCHVIGPRLGSWAHNSIEPLVYVLGHINGPRLGPCYRHLSRVYLNWTVLVSITWYHCFLALKCSNVFGLWAKLSCLYVNFFLWQGLKIWMKSLSNNIIKKNFDFLWFSCSIS